MKPEKTKRTDFEKVSTQDFTICTIKEIAFEREHVFKFNGEEKQFPAIRFKFDVEGYKFPHYSRWMKFIYGEKSTLYLKFIQPLVENAKADMDFDIERLKGLRVKILWAQKDGFQYPETVRTIGPKLKTENIDDSKDEFGADNSVPF